MRFYLFVISVLCQNSTVTSSTFPVPTTIENNRTTLVETTTPTTIQIVPTTTARQSKPAPPVIIQTTAPPQIATKQKSPTTTVSISPTASSTTVSTASQTTDSSTPPPTTLDTKSTNSPTESHTPFSSPTKEDNNPDALSTGGIIVLVLAFLVLAAIVAGFLYMKRKELKREISKQDILSPNSASILPTYSSSSDESLKPSYPTSRPESLVYMANVSQQFEQESHPTLNPFRTQKNIVYKDKSDTQIERFSSMFDDTSSIYSLPDQSSNPYLNPKTENPFDDQFDSNIVSMMSGGQVSKLEAIPEESEEDLFYKEFYSQYYTARRNSSLRRRSISTVQDSPVMPKYLSRNSLDLE
ncbi:hypothetical protein HDV04_004333 [Boothiomyces sp. JEL0838]|nr:hypothetical protein HDV04_004333 [Boothiomyces sp. JEL0838]